MAPKTILAVLLFATAVVGSAADKVSVNGKWQIHTVVASRESDSTCTFVQTGADLAGNCTGPRGTVDLSGKVDEKKISWTYKTDSEGGPVTLNYRGALNTEGTMAGFVNVQEYGIDGEFTATLSQ